MNKCSLVDTRKNLMAAAALAEAGIDFVPMPVTSVEEKNELATKAAVTLIEMLEEVEWTEEDQNEVDEYNESFGLKDDKPVPVCKHCGGGICQNRCAD